MEKTKLEKIIISKIEHDMLIKKRDAEIDKEIQDCEEKIILLRKERESLVSENVAFWSALKSEINKIANEVTNGELFYP